MKARVQSGHRGDVSFQRLSEIQQQMVEMCEPRYGYDEFHKVTSERGFVKITLPKTKY